MCFFPFSVQELPGATHAPEDNRMLLQPRLLQPRLKAARARASSRGHRRSRHHSGVTGRATLASRCCFMHRITSLPSRCVTRLPSTPPRRQTAPIPPRSSPHRRSFIRLRFRPTAPRPTNGRQANSDGRVYRKRTLR